MADTVGLVVGIVSLGIQVCQGLITYYHDFKGQGNEIDNLSARLQTLCDTLATIESSVNGDPRIQAQPSAQQVQATILSTYSGIIRLETFLKRCRQATGDDSASSSPVGPARRPIYADVKRGIRRQMVKAAYPFRKGTLKSLKETVADLQANLSTAMAALHLDTSKAILDETASIKTVAKALPTSIEDIDARISALNDLLVRVSEGLPVLQVSVERIENAMESCLPALQSSLCKIAEDVPALKSRLVVKANLCSNTDTELIRQREGDDIEGLALNVRNLQLNLSRQPSLLKNALEDCGRGNLNSTVGLPRGSSNSSLAWCCCGPVVLDIRQTRYRKQGALFFRSMDIHRHLPGCPFEIFGGNRMVFGVNLLFCNYFLKGLFQASMSMTTGAGGYSISPNLTFRATVLSTTSPAFKIINSLEALKLVRPSQMVQIALKQLQEVFSDRTASPADLSTNGETILHAACRIWDQHRIHEFLSDPAGLVEYQRLIMYLCNAVKAVGISIVETDINGRTPFEILLDGLFVRTRCNTDILSLSSAMVAEGAEISEKYFQRPRSVLELSRTYPSDIIHPDINLAEYLAKAKLSIAPFEKPSFESQITAAVVSRNLIELENILRDGDAKNITLDSQGYSPLHRAVDWPEGTSKLINAAPHLINLTSAAGELPIHFACYRRCAETTKVLLEHGSHLNARGWYGLLYAVHSNDEEIIDLIIKGHTDSGMRLLELARLYLPMEKVLQIPSDRVPDADAPTIVDELLTFSHHIPELLDHQDFLKEWHSEPVYHVLFSKLGPNLVKTAQKLYEAGFLDVDTPNELGWTPLMQPWSGVHVGVDDAVITDWLLSKGADMGKLLPDESFNKTRATAAHYLATRIGSAFLGSLRRFIQYDGMVDKLFMRDSTLTRVFRKIAFGLISDECSCPCNLNGCLPLTVFLRRICGLKNDPVWKARLILFINWMSRHLIEHITQMIASGVALDIAQGFRDQYYSTVIRFLSFETLGIKHTCCHMRDNVFFGCVQFACRSLEEVTETTDEYGDMIEVLESLVDEFDIMIHSNHDVSLFEFVRRHWVPRIGEELRKLAEEWSNSLAPKSCVDMGIVWQPQEYECDEGWSDDVFDQVLKKWPLSRKDEDEENEDFWVWDEGDYYGHFWSTWATSHEELSSTKCCSAVSVVDVVRAIKRDTIHIISSRTY